MVWQTEIYPEKHLAVVRVFGKTTMTEVMERGARLFSSPDWRPGMRVLIDYRYLRDIDEGSYQSVRELTKQDRRFDEQLRGIRVAIVAEADAIYGLARIWETMSEDAPWEAKLFRDYEEALDWLEVDAADAPESSSSDPTAGEP